MVDQAKFKFYVFRHIVNKFIIEVLLVRLKVMMSRLRVLVTMTMTRLLPRVVVVVQRAERLKKLGGYGLNPIS